MPDHGNSDRVFWDQLARYDPLWAILSDPSRTGRRWDLRSFLETGRREVSLLMYQLRALAINVPREAALDFGCGVGRLTQALAAYFDRVVGVDVSPEMVRLATEINPHPRRVRYECNHRDDLALYTSGEFSFAYSNVVLQHIEPQRSQQYIRELLRVVGSGGVLVFQLPSHLRRPEEQRALSRAMAEQAYRASVRVESHLPPVVTTGSDVVLSVAITNTSNHVWSQSEWGPIRLGNHWLGRSGQMLIQDDGRAALPEHLGPGQVCRVTLGITAPREPGEYQLECDIVHEGISWFADKGSQTWRARVTCGSPTRVQQSPDEAFAPIVSDKELSLPDIATVEPPGPLPMHGVDRDVVLRTIKEGGGTVVHLEVDDRCGPEWVGYRYFVTKNDSGVEV